MIDLKTKKMNTDVIVDVMDDVMEENEFNFVLMEDMESRLNVNEKEEKGIEEKGYEVCYKNKLFKEPAKGSSFEVNAKSVFLTYAGEQLLESEEDEKIVFLSLFDEMLIRIKNEVKRCLVVKEKSIGLGKIHFHVYLEWYKKIHTKNPDYFSLMDKKKGISIRPHRQMLRDNKNPRKGLEYLLKENNPEVLRNEGLEIKEILLEKLTDPLERVVYKRNLYGISISDQLKELDLVNDLNLTNIKLEVDRLRSPGAYERLLWRENSNIYKSQYKQEDYNIPDLFFRWKAGKLRKCLFVVGKSNLYKSSCIRSLLDNESVVFVADKQDLRSLNVNTNYLVLDDAHLSSFSIEELKNLFNVPRLGEETSIRVLKGTIKIPKHIKIVVVENTVEKLYSKIRLDREKEAFWNRLELYEVKRSLLKEAVEKVINR